VEESENRRLDRRSRVAAAIAEVTLLRPLPEDARRVLADRADHRLFGPGEAVVTKGDPSAELFIIERGEVAVEVVRENGTVVEVSRLGPGQCFGEMGLLTGEPRSATVRAKTLCHLVVLDHDAFHQVLAAHPEVLDGMGSMLLTRQAELDAATTTHHAAAPSAERARRLISQIREFFRLV
jgi:CRP-like cAMP-binding protein